MACQPIQSENVEHTEWVNYINTAARLPFYRYRTLDRSAAEIRLVSLAPHDDLSLSVSPEDCLSVDESEVQRMAVYRTIAQYSRPLLRCRIEHTSLTEAPLYSALSYTWGDDYKRAIIVGDRILLVTENLYSALAHIEFPNERIWIDAICINQEDQQEKSWQVQQMRKIYQLADHTAAWLGGGTDESDQLMTQMGLLGGMSTRYSSDTIEKFPFSVQAFSDWSRRRYWNRVWIQQEQRASQDITLYCGRKSLPRNHLTLAVELLRRKTMQRFLPGSIPLSDDPHEANLTLTSYLSMAQRLLRFSTSQTTMQLLNNGNGDLEATDRRDYVYALLGMASDAEELGIVVDYTKSWQQVFAEFAIALINREGCQIITFCNLEESSVVDPELPSWAPDWTRNILTPFRNSFVDTEEPLSRYSLCSGDVQATFPVVEQGFGTSNLLIAGTRIDIILEVGSSHGGSVKETEAELHASWLVELETLSVKGGDVYGSVEGRHNAIWRTAVADLLQDTEADEFKVDRAGADVEMGFNLVRAGYRSSNRNVAGGERNDIEHEAMIAHAYTRTLGAVTMDRKYFVSKEGYLGLGPGATTPEDLIVILFGLDMPFILRPAGDGRYRIIGESYLHGIMDGEFMNRRPVAETFTIC